jgi:signal transduction histidine kinase/ActR/RegA family two-component response regulator
LDANENLFVAVSTEVFVLLDGDARCTRVAIGGAAATALDFDRWPGHHIRDCFADADQKLLPALERARSSSSPQRIDAVIPASETASDKARQFEITVMWTGSSSTSPDRTAGWALALRDVTESTAARKLEARLEHDEMLDALGILTGSIAHDFNNLLVSISSFAERAKRDAVDGHLKGNIEAIITAVHRGRDLTHSLSSFARGGELTLRPVELVPLLEEIAASLRALRPDWEITLTMPAAGARVRGDASQLHRALMNVGKNAIDAVGDRAEARIALSLETRKLTEDNVELPVPAGTYALLRIEDQGRGIDETTMARMFDPFFSRKALGEGSGLGLFVVQGIARAHGGGVHVTSSPGRCTSFVIALPLDTRADDEARALAAAPAPIESSPPLRSEPASAEPARLLIVDDDPNVGRSLKLLLEGLGHDVVLECDPKAALERAKAAAPSFDLVLTDLTMPTLDGLTLARELARVGHTSPVVLVSGRDAIPRPDALAGAGIAALLPKPFTLNELEVTLARLLVRGRDRGRDAQSSRP